MQAAIDNTGARTPRGNLCHVSILIPTHNRRSILTKTFESLRGISIPADANVEMIVVANACTDGTEACVQELAQAMPFPTRCVVESQLGLSHARNRALAEAKGDILAFLDDDVWVEPGWLNGLLAVFREQPADIVVGPVALWWDAVERPAWLGGPVERVLSCINHGTGIIELHEPGLGIGANFALLREVVSAVGLFNVSLGRSGDQVLAGEETEYLMRAFQAGKRMFYAPDAAIRHWVAPSRLSLEYLHMAAYGNGLARPFLMPRLSRGAAFLMMAKYGARAAAYSLLEFLGWMGMNRKARINHHVRRMTCWGNVVGAWRRIRNRDCGGEKAQVGAAGKTP